MLSTKGDRPELSRSLNGEHHTAAESANRLPALPRFFATAYSPGLRPGVCQVRLQMALRSRPFPASQPQRGCISKPRVGTGERSEAGPTLGKVRYDSRY